MSERLTKDYVIMFLNSRNAKLLSDNIKLIRIPYWEKVNIKDILSKELLNG